jgi:hypothetical protein
MAESVRDFLCLSLFLKIFCSNGSSLDIDCSVAGRKHLVATKWDGLWYSSGIECGKQEVNGTGPDEDNL